MNNILIGIVEDILLDRQPLQQMQTATVLFHDALTQSRRYREQRMRRRDIILTLLKTYEHHYRPMQYSEFWVDRYVLNCSILYLVIICSFSVQRARGQGLPYF
uniref:Uncharacterized protein n=1 Tax=Cacopsylla melanoneura TaxID=428564 RepID=A0A8D8ZC61_9HEMI